MPLFQSFLVSVVRSMLAPNWRHVLYYTNYYFVVSYNTENAKLNLQLCDINIAICIETGLFAQTAQSALCKLHKLYRSWFDSTGIAWQIRDFYKNRLLKVLQNACIEITNYLLVWSNLCHSVVSRVSTVVELGEIWFMENAAWRLSLGVSCSHTLINPNADCRPINSWKIPDRAGLISPWL